MRIERVTSTANRTRPYSAVIEYHLTYRDSGGVVIADFSAPASRGTTALARGTLRLLNWSKIRRIRLRSDSDRAEILLASGRSMYDDRSFVLASLPTSAQAANRGVRPPSAEQRLRGLRSMIKPFIRRTPSTSAISRPASDDAAAIDSSVWVQAADGIDVAVSRRRNARRLIPNAQQNLETILEVSNARVSGRATLLP